MTIGQVRDKYTWRNAAQDYKYHCFLVAARQTNSNQLIWFKKDQNCPNKKNTICSLGHKFEI